MPTPEQVQRAQTALRNPNLPPQVRQKLERVVKFAPAPQPQAQPQAAPAPQPQAQPQAAPAPQPQAPGPPPTQQPVVESPQDQAALQDAQVQSPAEQSAGGAPPAFPNPEDIRFDEALYQLRQSFEAADHQDVDPLNIDDPGTLTRMQQRVKQRESVNGVDSSLKSMTQRPALYRPPVAGERPADTTKSNTLMYYEPEVDEVVAAHRYALQQAEDEGDKTGVDRAQLVLDRLDQDGRESEAYKKYADLKWVYVSHAANTAHSPQRVIRAAFAPEGEGGSSGTDRMAPMGVGVLEGLSFGLSTDAMAALEDRSKSPVGQRLKEMGLGLGPNWAQSARDTGSAAEYWLGNALGLIAPWGPANLVLKGTGKVAQSLGSAGARIGAQALADFGIDATSSVFRQMLKAAASGQEQDVSFGQAALEGALGGAAGVALGSVPAELARGLRENLHATNPLISAQVDAGNVRGHGTGRRGILSRTAEYVGERPLTMKGVEGGFPERASIQDDLIQRSISAAQPKGPKAVEGASTVTGKAARYVAEQVQPGLNKATRERTKLIAFKASRYAKSPAAQQKHPVQNAFTKIHSLWQDVTGSTDSVRKSAARTLTELSDVRVVNQAEAEALQARAKGGAGEAMVVVPMDDDVVRFMAPDKLRKAERAYQARAQRGLTEGWDEGLSSTIPAPPFQPPPFTPDPAMNQALQMKQGPTSSHTTVPVPGGKAMPDKLPGPPPVPRELADTLPPGMADSLPLKAEKPPAQKKFVVLKPKVMNAVEYTKALQDIDEQLFTARGEAGGSAALREAAAALRDDAAQWPGLQELRAEHRRLLTDIEGAERFTGLKTEELAGRSVDRADRGSVRDMALNRLAGALENRAYGGTGMQDLGSQGLSEYLENPRLTGLLKGLRAVAAWEAQQGNRMATTRMGLSGTGPFGVISDVSAYIGDKLYAPAGALEQISKAGKLPQQMRILLTPEARQFLSQVSEKTLGDLIEADHEREAKEAEQ